jgi:GT2 family glycosyltransferase
MTRADPHFSILMATRNRAERLDACLDRLLALGGGHDREFILVDNGSTDATGNVLARFQRACPWPALLIREPSPGASRALNRGLARARGRILVFTDDDCYAEPDLLDAFARTFADPRIGFAGGRILLHDPDDSRLALRESLDAELLSPGTFVAPGWIQGANMAFRREALLQIGGFDPNFGAGARFSGGDVDACGRAGEAGWYGAYDPLPSVRHHHGRRAKAARRHAARYAVGGGAYLAKRLVHSRWRLRDLGAMLRFTCGRRSPIAILRQLSGSVQYVALRIAGRLPGAGDPSFSPGGEHAEAEA